MQGRLDEWDALRGQLLDRVGREPPPGADSERADLWVYLLGNDANRARERHELAAAEAAYRGILDYLLARDDPALEPKIATGYHQLGMVAQEWGQFDRAEAWYHQALEIHERLGLERDAAGDYHQLGNVAYWRGQFNRAEAWYRQALEIFERLGHPPLLVNTLAQMGLLRRDQARPGQAVAWLGRALFIAANYQMRVTGQTLADLARLMGVMGEEAFTAAWREAFPDQAPPWDALRRALEDLEGEG